MHVDQRARRIVIAIVGGGSSLAQGGIELFRRRGDQLVVFSRNRPELPPNAEWVETRYDVNDGSLDGLATKGIRTVVWLASPFPRGLLVKQDEMVIRQALDSGLLYPAQFAKACLSTMIQTGFGRFVFAGSSLANIGDEGALLYMIIKQGIHGLSRGLAMEYARLGVRSNVIDLGPMVSGYAEHLPRGRAQEYRNRSVRRKFITSEEFWESADFLIGSNSINGVVLTLDGGMR